MRRFSRKLATLLGAMALLVIGCSGSSQRQAAVDGVSQPVRETVAVAEDSTPAPTAAAEPVAAEPVANEPVVSGPLLLPDPQRWVVVEDWSVRNAENRRSDDLEGLQLDVAPLSEDGVPQLGLRISMSYRFGSVEDFDRWWGDSSSMGEPVEFDIEGGLGRSVRNEELGFAAAQIWKDGTFVSIQTMGPDADVTALAQSVTPVDDAAWNAARSGAEDQRLVAIQAAMADVEPVATHGEPLPHWVLPEPWQLSWVTDKTIWTPEQHAQSVAYIAANQPPGGTVGKPDGYRVWQFGFADNAGDAAQQFVPQITVAVVVVDEAHGPLHPTNYETISALGLNGVISAVGGISGMMVELGTADVRVNIQSRNLGEARLREFLDAVEFVSSEPLDGLVVSDPRFQPVELAEWDSRPASWHAAWTYPGARDAAMSVWRMSIPELRVWLMGRGDGLTVPEGVWETVASDGVIEFGRGTSYNVSTGLLTQLSGIDRDDLIPITLDDWIALVEPVNTDPINPR